MDGQAEPICFTCGEPAGSPPRMNRLEDGRGCPACMERVQEALPPALPGFGRLVETDTPVDGPSDWELGPA